MLERDHPRTQPDSPTSFGRVVWRSVAAVLYALALLLVGHDLLGAVLLLMAALWCLPGARAAVRQATGMQLPGAASFAPARSVRAGPQSPHAP